MEFMFWAMRPILIAALIGGCVNWMLDSVETAGQHMAGALTIAVED